jgi:putative addiction module component (TIGR02574 family)
MTPDAERILRDALSLPDDARMDLAEALLASVEDEPTDEGADAAWSDEAKRRLEEVRSGAVRAVPWDEAEKQIFGPRRNERSPQANGSTISNVSSLRPGKSSE